MMDERYLALFQAACHKKNISDREIDLIRTLYAQEGIDAVYETAKKKKMLPFVAALFKQIGIHDQIWAEVLYSFTGRNERVIEALSEVYGALKANGAQKIVVTENFGAFLSEGPSEMALFASGDVDNYAARDEKEAIYDAFSGLGYDRKERWWQQRNDSVTFTNLKRLPDDFQIGVQWTPTTRLKMPPLQYCEEVVDWEHLRYYRDTGIALPDREALLYICMLHISVHRFASAPDIRLYIDIVNAIAGGMDWTKIIEWAVRDDYRNRIATAAFLAKTLLACDIPDSIIHLSDNENHRKLLDLVFDPQKNCLKLLQTRADLFLAEVYANDRNVYCGIRDLLCPGKKWLLSTYGDPLVFSYFKFVAGMLRG